MRARAAAPKKSHRIPRTGKSGKNSFRVLFIEESHGWAAQVLDYDIATQADTLQALFYEVERLLVSYIALAASQGRIPFQGLPPAPQKYWDLFERSKISMQRPASGLRVGKAPKPKIVKDIRIAESIAA